MGPCISVFLQIVIIHIASLQPFNLEEIDRDSGALILYGVTQTSTNSYTAGFETLADFECVQTSRKAVFASYCSN